VIILGDCLTELRSLADESVDSIVTDPPYGLAFMGKKWDYDVPGVEVWKECFRVLKPGGHLLSFFGSRTYHRGVIPIEDAGFEIRDQIMWVYGSGFPKSHNISKAIDKAAKAERVVIGRNEAAYRPNAVETHKEGQVGNFGLKGGGSGLITAPATPEAKKWEGWGTALKPAHEPIVVARKPVQGTVAENVLEHGTGGINIDESRIGTEFRTYKGAGSSPQKIANHTKGDTGIGMLDGSGKNKTFTVEGRFPANVIHDGVDEPWGHYFYCAKASKKDRDEGLEALETPKENLQGLDTRGRTLIREDGTKSLVERWKPKGERKNNHPTVKPTDLMRYLCRLVTPPGGVVLDPFMGSGSTGKAAQKEGFEFIGIECEPEYVEIARQRI